MTLIRSKMTNQELAEKLRQLLPDLTPPEWDWMNCNDPVCDCVWVNGDRKQLFHASRGYGDENATDADLAMVPLVRNNLDQIIAALEATP